MSLTNADVLAEYQELRAVQRALNVDLTKTLSHKAVEETARRLGLWEAGRIVFEDEEEVQVLNDSAIHDYFPSGKNAVERYAALVPGVGVQARAALVARSFRDTMLRGVAAAALDPRTRSRLGWILFHLASLEPEDARDQLAAMTAFDLPPSGRRREAVRSRP